MTSTVSERANGPRDTTPSDVSLDVAAPGAPFGMQPPKPGMRPPRLRFLPVLLGIFLMHSALVGGAANPDGSGGGVNASISDLVLAALLLAVARRMVIPPRIAMAFLGICFITVLTATLVTPAAFGTGLDHMAVIRDLSKLVMAFLWFIAGYTIARADRIGTVIRYFSWAGLATATIGTVMSMSTSSLLRETMFLEGVRFRGFMIDPNLCAVMLVASLPYFLNRPSALPFRRLLALALVVGGVLATGSKTGLATLVLYLGICVARHLLVIWRTRRASPAAIFAIVAVLLGLALAPSIGPAGLDGVAQLSPGAERSISAFMGESELDGSGSGRGAAFASAVQILQAAPVLGVGVGSYTAVALKISGYPEIAHNTYLQVACEWGLPLALAFFVAIGALLVISPRGDSDPDRESMILRDICYILLLGGLAISLNNVRLFWVVLGALLAAVTIRGRASSGDHIGQRQGAG